MQFVAPFPPFFVMLNKTCSLALAMVELPDKTASSTRGPIMGQVRFAEFPAMDEENGCERKSRNHSGA